MHTAAEREAAWVKFYADHKSTGLPMTTQKREQELREAFEAGWQDAERQAEEQVNL